MSYDGRAVANYVLDRCDSNGRQLTNLALQKILYFCHSWTLVKLGRPLIKHEFEAWQYGPVLQYIYRDFKNFDREPITARASKLDPSTGKKKLVEYSFTADVYELLDRVVDAYSRFSPGTLVALSHTEGGPWDVVWNHRARVNPGMRITDDLIAAYFSKAHPPF